MAEQMPIMLTRLAGLTWRRWVNFFSVSLEITASAIMTAAVIPRKERFSLA